MSMHMRAAAQQDQQARRSWAPLVLFGLFIVVLLLSLVAGIKVYGSLADAEDAINSQRFGTGLMVNSVRGADSYDALSVGVGPEGDALVMTESTPAGNVETRLFLYQGALMQQYAVAGAPFSPEDSVEVMRTDSFAFHFDDGLITLITDEGDVEVAIRAEGVRL